MHTKTRLYKIGTSLVVAFVLSILAFLPALAYKTFFADSEIWAINLGYHFSSDFQHYWVLSRAVFYFPIYLITLPFNEPQNIFFAARVLMIVNAFIQCYLVFRIVRSLISDRLLQWFALFILISNSYYLTQIFQVRSDLFATTFILLGIYGLQQKLKRFGSAFLVGCPIALALFSTPKAILLIPCLLIYFLFEPQGKKIWKPALVTILLAAGMVISAVYLRLGYLSDLSLDLKNYMIAAYTGSAGTPHLLSARGFMYVTKFFTENFWFVLVLFGVYLISIRREFLKWYLIHTYLLLMFLMVPEKLPFFICSLLPLFVCTFMGILSCVVKDKRKESSFYVAALIVCFCVFLFSSVKIMKTMNDYKNTEQLTAAQNLYFYLEDNRNLNYYDVIGISPKHSNLRHFSGPNQPQTNKIVSKIVQEAKPDVILQVNKLNYLGLDFISFLKANYIHLGNGFFIRAFPVPQKVAASMDPEHMTDELRRLHVSPLFENHKESRLVFEAQTTSAGSFLFISKDDLAEQNYKGTFRGLKVSPIPLPDKMPPRSLEKLFNFDTEF